MYDVTKRLTFFFMVLAASLSAQELGTPGSVQNARFATDAYPGFDSSKESTPERKEPRWFAFINGPDCGDAAAQMVHCRSLEAEGKWSKAAKQLDALVREWPTSKEAPEAQLALARILEEREDDLEEAFSEYRYLLDFFSLSCDYNAIADKLYEIAGKMRVEGKTIVFFRFKNTVDVRRAFEAAVLRAPGAKWAPKAMLEIADLREEEGHDSEAVKVYENLRNIHYGTPEAAESIVREARARMRILKACGYNRDRSRDTLSFLEMALKSCKGDDLDVIGGFISETKALIEDEAYRAAVFYDSRMRTKRSAINALERFLAEYPGSAHAADVKARLEELKGAEK